jgi:hypothetical protein
LSTATSELPGLLPVYVQEKERYHYSSFKAILGGMADSYYEVMDVHDIGCSICDK